MARATVQPATPDPARTRHPGGQAAADRAAGAAAPAVPGDRGGAPRPAPPGRGRARRAQPAERVRLAAPLQRERSHPKRTRLFVILDGLHNTHDHPRFRALCRELGITLVFTPTEASWLNLIEPHFGALRRATLVGSDDRDHVVRRRRIYRCLRPRDRERGKGAHPLTRIRMVKPIKLDRH